MDSNLSETIVDLAERVAVLETKLDDLKEIKDKLDELLHLKSQGMGALTLVGMILGSGVIGLVLTLMNFFKPHL